MLTYLNLFIYSYLLSCVSAICFAYLRIYLLTFLHIYLFIYVAQCLLARYLVSSCMLARMNIRAFNYLLPTYLPTYLLTYLFT